MSPYRVLFSRNFRYIPENNWKIQCRVLNLLEIKQNDDIHKQSKQEKLKWEYVEVHKSKFYGLL
jgi:Txe/YoeB family toxin of Txe-Axe toxin-antitoxin module